MSPPPSPPPRARGGLIRPPREPCAPPSAPPSAPLLARKRGANRRKGVDVDEVRYGGCAAAVPALLLGLLALREEAHRGEYRQHLAQAGESPLGEEERVAYRWLERGDELTLDGDGDAVGALGGGALRLAPCRLRRSTAREHHLGRCGLINAEHRDHLVN